ncbi:hypothetical protein JCM33774_60640 [Actinophytocola sp. KF-1]
MRREPVDEDQPASARIVRFPDLWLPRAGVVDLDEQDPSVVEQGQPADAGRSAVTARVGCEFIGHEHGVLDHDTRLAVEQLPDELAQQRT